MFDVGRVSAAGVLSESSDRRYSIILRKVKMDTFVIFKRFEMLTLSKRLLSGLSGAVSDR